MVGRGIRKGEWARMARDREAGVDRPGAGVR